MMQTSTVMARPTASVGRDRGAGQDSAAVELRLPDAFPDVCMAEPGDYTTADGTARRPLSRPAAVYCIGTRAHSSLAGSRENSRRSPVLMLP